MATKPKKQASYDLRKADRKRNLAIQIGLTSIVVIFAVVLVGYIFLNKVDRPASGETKAIRVESSNVIKKDGSSDPKVVLSMYEDFLCPHCGLFEQQFGPTVSKLIDSGAVAADYYMVAILDRQGNGYSSRAANAAYCVADESIDAFRRFHAALYAQQPQEGSATYPDNARLIEIARQAGAGGGVPDCINKNRYTEMVKGLAAATKIQATPTIRINGEDFAITEKTTPNDLVAKVKTIVGDVPGLEAAPAAPVPTPGAAPAALAPVVAPPAQAPTPGAAPAAPVPGPLPPAAPSAQASTPKATTPR
ncbi:MAG TPA: DsbA family protein [Mycobacterium sp.]|nr:DsbA family protein [Mycobacterium sp.]